MVFIYSIEGNIGSGKSTVIEQLKNENIPGVLFLPEPVDIWSTIKDSSGVTILEKYYQNPEKYAFSFQMMAYITRLSHLKNCIENVPQDTIIVTERCLYTDREIFAKMLYDTGKIEEIEYSIYTRWFDEFSKINTLAGIIYIKTTPEICLSRIKKRNRIGEDISIEYLSLCHDYHEKWISNENNILLLNGNTDSNDFIKQLSKFIS